MKPQILALSEIRVEKDDYIEVTCLINPAYILSCHRGELTKPGPHVIGTERNRELTQIYLNGNAGRPIFVNESVEEIGALIGKL